MLSPVNRCDVIVVGGGGSGLAAAASAAENGLSVLVLEKRPDLGGTTGIAVGSFTANRTRWQRAAGIQDSAEAHAEDAAKFPQPEIERCGNGELRRFFLAEAATTLEWLAGMGLSFVGPSPEPPNRVPRMHNVVPNAKAYIAALQSRVLRLGGELWCEASADALLQEKGRVVGVVARVRGERRELRATRGVVLAAGDYANNSELIARYKGERFAAIEGINPYATGEGHLLAEAAGAALCNMPITYGPELRFVSPPGKPFSQLLPSRGALARLMGAFVPLLPKACLNWMIQRLLVTWQHPENALFDDGAILVNRLGRRFCNERVWPDREIALSRQPDKVGYIVLDGRLVERYSAWPHFISTAPEIAYAYMADYVRLRPDVAAQGESLKVLAESRGIVAEELERTVAERSESGRGEMNDRFGREGREFELASAPWAILGPVKAYFTTTEGGVVIDRDLRVLTAEGKAIEGLYAVGQTGLGGQVLWGHGLHIAWAMTSGRLVGRVLAGATPGGGRE